MVPLLAFVPWAARLEIHESAHASRILESSLDCGVARTLRLQQHLRRLYSDV